MCVIVCCIVALASESRARDPDDAIPELVDGEPSVSVDSPLGPIEYTLGRGLRVGSAGLWIGGFTTLELERQERESARIALDSVNFLVSYEPIDLLRLFAEVEVGHLLDLDTSDGHFSSNPDVTIERLYADLRANDALNLRIGKFQTPVGRWNLIPAEPFVWTAEEPVFVATAFDEHQTGLALFGSAFQGPNILSYWLYGQVVEPLDPPSDETPVDRSVGGRLEYSSARWEWSAGSSFLASELNGNWSYLGGLDAQGRLGPLELTAEFGIQRGDIPGRSLWDVYLQGVYDLEPVTPWLRGFYAVGRYEHFDPIGSPAVNLWDLGITWIPAEWLNVKVGYRLSDRETEDVRRGLKATLSVLF